MPLPPYLTALRNLVQTDISGTGTPASTVTGPDAFGDAAVVGGSTNFAREDHNHGLPASPTLGAATSVVGPDAYGAAAVVGTSTKFARQDHDHGLPAATGGTPASTVVGPDAYGAPAVVGISTLYARADHDHGLPANTGALIATTVAGPAAFGDSPVVGTGVRFARNDHNHGLPVEAALALLTAEIARAEAAELALSARVALLEAANNPGGGVVTAFNSSQSKATFQALCANMSIDGIAMAPGTYHIRSWNIDSIDRTSRPLTIYAATGAVIIDNAGDGDYGDAPFPLNSTAHVTFDGTGGGFTFQHTLLAEVGLFNLVGVTFFTAKYFTVRHCAGNANAADQESAHCAYTSRNSHDITYDHWDIDLIRSTDESGGVYSLNGFQFYTGGTGSAIYNVAVTNASIVHANWAIVVRNSTTGCVFNTITVNLCGNHGVPAAVDFDSSGSTGTVSNVHTTNSAGTPHIMGSMTDGGGNSWA